MRVDLSHPAPDRRLVARSLGLLYLVGPALAELWLVLAWDSVAHVVPFVATCLITQAFGLVMRRGALDQASPRLLKAILALGTLVAGSLYAASGSAGGGFAYFFLWTTPYAFFFGRVHAVAQIAFAAACLTGIETALSSDSRPAADLEALLLPIGSLLIVGLIVNVLAGELGRAGRERLASELERAEAESRRAATERVRARREAAMARLGRLALLAQDGDSVLREVVSVLTDTLEVEHCSILELSESGSGVRVSAGAGLGLAGELPADPRTLTGWVLAGDEPALVWEWASERRLRPAGQAEHPLRSTLAAAVRGRTGAFGIVAVHSESVGAFSAEEGRWLQSVADLLASALDRERSESVMRHQSLHDALTGLPNRSLLVDRVDQAFARARREEGLVAVMLLDVDNFKTVNDSLGHEAGDDLLVSFGACLQQVVRGSDTVCRLGGDEFVVLCVVADRQEAFAISQRLADGWSQPFAVAGGEVFVSASVGIAVADEPETAEKLLREADAAMYRAKDAGRGRSELFDEDMRQHAFERLRTESDLRRAHREQQFRLHYQPIIDLGTGRPVGVEALVRWQHPTRGLVSPAEFIPLAEETGVIAPLGRWVLEQAAADVGRWRARFPDAADLRVTVNVSGRQLARPEFLDEVVGALRSSGLAPGAMGLEITESVLMRDVTSPRSTLEALRARGLRVLLDDFGTGYSSLARLKHFPLDAIKVDRSFVGGLGHTDEDSAIVAAIVEIARSLGLQVIAEGVETDEQHARLRELGCDAAQGYLFARPLDARAIEALLGDQVPAAVSA